MRTEILFATEDHETIQTMIVQTITLSAESIRRYADKPVRINLTYDNQEMVPGTKKELTLPDTLAGVDYENGVRINADGCATFKVKVLALSSQHENRRFRFKLTILLDNAQETIFSSSFRTLSKISRKRKLTTPLTEIELQESIEEMLGDTMFPTLDGWKELCDTWNDLREKTMQLLSLQTEIARLTERMGSHMSKMSLHRMTPSNAAVKTIDASSSSSSDSD